MVDDLVLEQLRNLRQDIKNLPTKEDLAGLPTKDDLAAVQFNLRGDLEALRGEMLRHFVEVETRMTTELTS